MKILLAHNFYQQAGGEDQVFAAEGKLLEERGHEVVRYSLHNDAIDNMGRFAVARTTFWNRGSYRDLKALITRHRPDVLHLHNTFPLISPSAYGAARQEGVPVVQTLHNFRLACANSLFLRDGKVCTDCLGKSVPWPAVRHACYRDNRSASAVVASMHMLHRMWGTWQRSVGLFLVLTAFQRSLLLKAGLPSDRVVVKPNFVPDPGPSDATAQRRGGLFVGRLGEEKGIQVLVAAAKKVECRLDVVGDGDLAAAMQAQSPSTVAWLGSLSRDEVLAKMRSAAFVVVPSICFETFSLVICEAFATGTPVIASRLGAPAELIEDGQTGLHFEVGNADDLAAKIRWASEHPGEMRAMGQRARSAYEDRYSADVTYGGLLSAYETVCR